MKTIRIGNDINVSWSVFARNGSPYPLTGKGIELWLTSGPYRTRISSFNVESSNILSFSIEAADLKRYGVYTLTLRIFDTDDRSSDSAFDFKELFQIVSASYTQYASSVLDGAVDLEFRAVLTNLVVYSDPAIVEKVEEVDQRVSSSVASLDERVTVIEDVSHDSNRPYDPAVPDVMGYKILQPGESFASQLTSVNTIYDIRHEFSLGNTGVQVPEGSTLLFSGGVVTDGQLHLTDSRVISLGGDGMFKNASISGTVTNEELPSAWFSDADDFIRSVNNTTGYNVASLKEGDYDVSQVVDVNGRSDFHFEGNNAVLNYSSQKHGFRVNTASGLTDSWPSEALEDTYAKGADAIVTSLSVKKGDALVIRDLADYSFSNYRNYKDGEFCEVVEAGEPCRLKNPLMGNYLNEGSIMLYKPSLTKLTVRNLTITYDVTDDTAHVSLINGMFIKFCRDVVIENVKVLNFDIGINLVSCYGASLSGTHTVSCVKRVSDLYGVMIGNSQDVTVKDSECRGGNHGISVGGNYSGIADIINRRISVHDCVCSDFRANYVGGIETHGNCEYFNVLNNVTTGIGLAGNHTRVSGNMVRNAPDTGASGITVIEMTGFDHIISDNFIEGSIYVDKYYDSGSYNQISQSENYTVNADEEALVVRDNTIHYDASLMNNVRNKGPVYLITATSNQTAAAALANKAIRFEGNTIMSSGAYLYNINSLTDVRFSGNRLTNSRFSLTRCGDFRFESNSVVNDSDNQMFSVAFSNDIEREFVLKDNRLYYSRTGAIRWINLLASDTKTVYRIEGNGFLFAQRESAVNVYFIEKNSYSNGVWVITGNRFQYQSGMSALRINITADDVTYDGNVMVDSEGKQSSGQLTLQVSATKFTNHQRKAGTTAQRPTTTDTGQAYFDTTLGSLIVWDGSDWVNADGTSLS